MRILVAGGAGYIGSHTIVELIAAGHDPVILDNFCNARRSTLEGIATITARNIPVIEADLRDQATVDWAFTEAGPFDAVFHFAGLKAVSDSVRTPLAYYHNNVAGTITLLRAMERHRVYKLVFSSSATVYGAASQPPFTENAQIAPTNPYGWTKAQIEQILADVSQTAPHWRIAVLRYFNPVGAHPSGLIGEDPLNTPNNIMPIITQVATGVRNSLTIYGSNYNTVDGTGVRDYVHVVDLASGHIAALQFLNTRNTPIRVWNLGTGSGTSVLELVQTFERASGRKIRYDIERPRLGDVPVSYADPRRANAELTWTAVRDVNSMCLDSWRWAYDHIK